MWSNLVISQNLSGLVLDDETSEAIPFSEVFVLDEMNMIIATTKTDKAGIFIFDTIGKGTILQVRDGAYAGFETEINGQEWVLVRLEPIKLMASPGGEGSAFPGVSIPDFPWPPPLPSTKTEIPFSVFKSCRNLGDVKDILSVALLKNGYSDNSYFLVPANDKNGFALATQLEQIDKDRVPKKDPNRWNTNILNNKYVGWEYLTATFLPNPGFFRVIVFIVTDIPFVPKNIPLDQEVAKSWLYKGSSGFPEELRDILFNRDFKIYALVYEYEQKKAGSDAVLLKPSQYNAQAHLKKSHIWNSLVKN